MNEDELNEWDGQEWELCPGDRVFIASGAMEGKTGRIIRTHGQEDKVYSVRYDYSTGGGFHLHKDLLPIG